MISATKLDDSFPDGQFLIEGYHAPVRFDRSKCGGGIILCVREDIPAKVLCHDFPFADTFFVEINQHKNNITKHLELIRTSINTFYGIRQYHTSWRFQCLR